MQGSWYNYFLSILYYYYRFKPYFLFCIKFLISLKISSIFLDICCGYFPNIFKNSVYNIYILKFYNFSSVYFNYWSNIFWFLFVIYIFFFWFFFRIGYRDVTEIEKRLKIKEDLLKNLNKKTEENKIFNIQHKKFMLKIKLGNFKKLLKLRRK